MANTANISWTGASGAVSYTVEYKLHSVSTWTLAPGTNPTTNTTYAISGLTEGTAYDFRITTNCATGSGSQIIPATTPCGNVTGLTAAFVSGVAQMSWNRLTYAVSYGISYKLQSDSTWTTASGSPLANPGSGSTVSFNISGLTAGNDYDFRVITNCTSNSSGGVTTSASFSCPPVTGLSVSFA